MKRMILLIAVLFVSVAAIWTTPGSSQVLYEEHFTDGQAQLEWYPFFGRYYSTPATDTMQVIKDSTTPEGDGWIGVVAREDSVPCGMVWTGDDALTDYSIDAWVFVNVDTTESYGLYQGLCGRIDTTGFWGKYYRFVADFDVDQRLRLSYHYGEMMPVYLRTWSKDEIPGGVPSDSSWHRMKLKLVANSIWAYWDGQILPGCPVIHDSLDHGYFGVYVFRMWMSEGVETRVDDIMVCDESPIPERVDDLTVTLVGEDLVLEWSAVTVDTNGNPLEVDLYRIYRDNVAFFGPGSDPFDGIIYTTYMDTSGVVGNTGTHYYFAVTAVTGGKESGFSGLVGEFDQYLSVGK
ncbi:hypothetical protein KAX22_06555 [bacterium]|nr:hypothetical protein [bacterium]